jgi:nicotinamide mononucleotide transporter
MFGFLVAAWFAVPRWVLDWSGSVLVVISLVYLLKKHGFYWHYSNASLLPYFALFMSQKSYMLASLQVSYLIFGIHGLLLWKLERQREEVGRSFNDRAWYNAGWIMSLAIFALAVGASDLSTSWAKLQFVVVAVSSIANWATTRKWTWSWPLWLVVNSLQAILFWHDRLLGQFLLQFVLFGMSVRGWMLWAADDRRSHPQPDHERQMVPSV